MLGFIFKYSFTIKEHRNLSLGLRTKIYLIYTADRKGEGLFLKKI